MLTKSLIFSAVMMVAQSAFSAPRYGIVSDIPTTHSSSDVVLPAQGSRDRNCLEYVIASSTAAYILRVLDGNTTSYQLTKSATCPGQNNFSGTPLCGSVNTTMTIKVTPVSDTGAAKEINYSGFVGR